jgi:hypothetical protein
VNGRRQIAERLRALIGGQNQGDLERVAERLGVDEVSLRVSVDELAPYPTLDVLLAVIEVYGVDPSWLLTGEYNSATHVRALGERRRPERAALRRLITELSRSIPLSRRKDEGDLLS